VIAGSRRLLLRIYAVSVAQLLAVAGTIALVGWLTFKPDTRSGPANEARYAIANLGLHLDDPAALEVEVKRIHLLTGGTVSVYGPKHKLLATSISPPLGPLTPEELAQLEREGGTIGKKPPHPLVAFPLDARDPSRGYGVYRPERPHKGPDRMLWGLTAALTVAAIAAVGLARSIARPLADLTQAAKRLGGGDLTVRVRSTRRDEFGELAEAFDDMAERLTRVLRSQQELLANVSHELRTPLARIRVALDLAAEGDADMAREALGEIAEDLGELERLVADVLQTARLDLAAGRAVADLPVRRSEDVDVAALLDATVQRFRASHPKRQLGVLCNRELPRIQGDPALLRRALDNLLENARAYSDEGAPIDLVACVEDHALSLVVTDRGIGIAPEELPNIATPFYRTDPSRARRTGGLGLGLSLARRIVESHRGTLDIESELGRGTSVRIKLPLPEGAHVEV